jgi:8-oxo-dGTP diphosphatase
MSYGQQNRIDGKYYYDYRMPSLVVDLVVTAANKKRLLLVERKQDPWKGCLALPGGFMEIDELIIDAARRELKEETGIIANVLTLVGWYDEPYRDPRGRIVSVAFHIDCGDVIPDVKGMDDVRNAMWVTQSSYCDLVSKLRIAADHTNIIGDVLPWGII